VIEGAREAQLAELRCVVDRLAGIGTEAGLAVELVRLVGVYTSRAANAVSCVYLAHPLDPAAAVVTDLESDDHAWVARGDVPAWLPRMAFPSMAAALDDWAAGRSGLARDW